MFIIRGGIVVVVVAAEVLEIDDPVCIVNLVVGLAVGVLVIGDRVVVSSSS